MIDNEEALIENEDIQAAPVSDTGVAETSVVDTSVVDKLTEDTSVDDTSITDTSITDTSIAEATTSAIEKKPVVEDVRVRNLRMIARAKEKLERDKIKIEKERNDAF